VSHKRTVIGILVVIAAGAVIAAVVLHLRRWRPRFTVLQGAVIRSDKDAYKEVPVADAIVVASYGTVSAATHSDASGYFRINFPEVIWPGETIALSIHHPDFLPQNLNLRMEFRSTTRRLIVVGLKPIAAQVKTVSGGPARVVSNIRIRYTENSRQEENVGSAARTFQVVNQGNVPCRHQGPCSPDGNWKAATVTVKLDAGVGNEFRDVRASCIAGPCPFTRIDSQGFEHGGRNIVATALDWSDTATFLLEAEVFHTSVDSRVNESYPVIFDRSLNFTLPASQEGVSIIAEIDGTQMVFPLAPDIYLDWATCNSRVTKGSDSMVYQCSLKPGYRF
jgi:hypothetical protein